MTLPHRILASTLGAVLILGATAVGLGLHPVAQAQNHHDSNSGGKAWLGVSLEDLDKRLVERLDLDEDTRGALVVTVQNGSPADKAGIRKHDVITRVNRSWIDSVDDLMDAMTDHRAGDEVELRLLRDGRTRYVDVELASWNNRESGSVTDKSGDNRWVEDEDDHWVTEEGGNVWFSDDDDDDADRKVIVVERDGHGHSSHSGHKVMVIDGLDRGGKGYTIDLDDLDIDSGNSIRIDYDDSGEHPRVLIFQGDDDEPQVIEINRNDKRVHMAPHSDRGSGSQGRRSSSQGFLGVHSQGLGDQLADYFGVSEGVLVTEVVGDSPAEESGLKAGDVIVQAAGKPVETPGELRDVVRRYGEGDEIELRIVRDRSRRTIEVTLGDTRDFSSNTFDLRFPRGLRTPHNPRTPFFALDHDAVDMEALHESLRGLEHIEIPELHLDLPEIQSQIHAEMSRLHEELNSEEMQDLHREIREGLHEGLREARQALREAHHHLNREMRELHEKKRQEHRLYDRNLREQKTHDRILREEKRHEKKLHEKKQHERLLHEEKIRQNEEQNDNSEDRSEVVRDAR